MDGERTAASAGSKFQISADLLRSRETEQSLHPDNQVDLWIEEQRAHCRLQVKPVPLASMKRWMVEPLTGNIVHESGSFFTFTGVEVRHRIPVGELKWDQPIIDQPEIGILGILTKMIDGVLHFCLQAKEEPGNINSVQLSPTVQATFSNYTRAHGGAAPLLVDYFLRPKRGSLIFGKLQTEDGGRFLFKSNKNMIVQIGDYELDVLPDGFIWLTLRQLANLLHRNNLVHATTRSVLSALMLLENYELSAVAHFWRDLSIVAGLEETLQWLDERKAANHLLVKRKGLNELKEWRLSAEGEFQHCEGRYFTIMGIEVTAPGREVPGWYQPIIANQQSGIIGLLIRNRQGARSFLVQAKAEAGNRTMVQLGPTAQFSSLNYRDNRRLPTPFLFEEFSNPGRFTSIVESMQPEEGARFYRESNCHRVLLLPEDAALSIPEDYRWVSEGELRFFLNLGESVNSCLRSAIACLL
jgi:oxidase EvaA